MTEMVWVCESKYWVDEQDLSVSSGWVVCTKRSRLHKTWAQSVNDDMRLSSLKAEDSLDSVKWRATMWHLNHKEWILI